MIDKEALTKTVFAAVINCGHTIEFDQVVLRYSESRPGFNALSQLHNRIRDAVDEAILASSKPKIG